MLSPTRSKAHQHSFPVWLISLGSNSGTLFVSEAARACQHYSDSFPATGPVSETGRRETTAQRDGQRARTAVANSVRSDRSSPVLGRDNICFSEDDYGLGGGVGRGLAVGPDLGVGVGLGVGVVVAVDVAVAVGVAVAVAVGVGVGVGPHAEAVAVAVGVGLGVAVGDGVPTAAAISIRPQPYTLFGGPAVPHCVEEINTAELFKASRLAVI